MIKTININNVPRRVEAWSELRNYWADIEVEIFNIQQSIFKATEAKDYEKVHELQAVIIDSWKAKLLAVRKVTADNKGKKTAGVDGVSKIAGKRRFALAEALIINNKTSPIRRVWIPKPGKVEKRPLGIPTIEDRAKQALVLLALEPQWEAMFSKYDWYSNGFRPGRSADNCRKVICQWIQKERYVVDADIAKCFDRINHKQLLRILKAHPVIQEQVTAWLKAGVMDRGFASNIDNELGIGTPQSGVISPLLANIALYGLYGAIAEGFDKRHVHIGYTRYADNFVIFCDTLEGAESALAQAKRYLAKFGLKISDSKTNIVKTTQGFDFLGFNFKTYNCSWHHCTLPRSTMKPKLLSRDPNHIQRGTTYYSKPSKKAIMNQRTRVKDFLKDHPTSPIGDIVRGLSFITAGWARYFCVSNSTRTFSVMDAWLYKRLMQWAARRCKGSRRRAFRKYFISVGKKLWCFGYRNSKGEPIYLRRYDSTKTPRATPIEKTASPYNGKVLYWIKRLSEGNKMTHWARKLLKRQDGKCSICHREFNIWDEMQIHHVKSRKSGGKLTNTNLVLLHRYCHEAVTHHKDK